MHNYDSQAKVISIIKKYVVNEYFVSMILRK